MGQTVTILKHLVKQHMKSISDAVNGLTKEVHNRALDLVLEEITKRIWLIERLLENGSEITSTVPSGRCRRLYDKRHELFMKKNELYEVQRILFKIYIR